MKHLNLLLFCLMVAVIVVACKKNTSSSNESNPPRVKSITKNGALVATLSYNDQGQLSLIDYAAGTNLTAYQEKLSYNASGQLVKAVTPHDSTMYTYNSTGQLIKSDDIMAWRTHPDPTDYKMVYTYDTNGRLLVVTTTVTNKEVGEKLSGKITHEYNKDGLISRFIITDGAGYDLKYEVEGYNSKINLNPIILDRFARVTNYFTFGGFAQIKQIPLSVKNFWQDRLFEENTFDFIIKNNRVSSINCTLNYNGNVILINYDLQY